MILDRNTILTANDLKTEDIECPEWGGTVRVRVLTGTERDAFGSSLIGADGKADMTNFRARLVAWCAVSETAAVVFTHDDVIALGGKSGTVLDRVFSVAERINGMGAASVATAAGN